MREKGKRPSLTDCGTQLPSGRARCRYRCCGRLCVSWLGLIVHLRRCHRVFVDDVLWSDIKEG